VKTAIHFQNTVKRLLGSPAVHIHDLRIYDQECVVFYGLTEEIAEIITHQITGAYSPEEGNVYIYGTNSREISESTWFEYVGNFGIYSSSITFRERSSIGENIAILFRGQNPSIEEPQLSAAVLHLANLVQLTITDLSYSMGRASSLVRMKARLARSLAYKPKLVIFYEPTEELSQDVTRKFLELIRRTRRKLKYTSLVFTSDVRFIQQIADRVLFLNPHSGVLIENQLRGWYHNLLPFLQPSPAKLLQLARDILQHSGVRTSKV
jgi:phospholipid/cholesterol/gamma-HCH transport system ATP-binding protein